MQMADEVHNAGYNVLIMNPVAQPPNFGDEKDLEVQDFSQNVYICQAVELLKE